MDEILEQIDLDLSQGSIDEQLEDVSFSKGQSDNLLEQIHFDLSTLQEREYELPEDHTMMHEGHKDALDIELERLKKDGPKPFFGLADLPDLIDQEIATQMLTPTGPASSWLRDYGNAMGYDAKALYKESTGIDWQDENEMRQKVEAGLMGDRERMAIVARQTSMADNMSRSWEELMLVMSDILPAAASGVGQMIDHAVEGDTEGLARDWEVTKDIAEIMAIEFGADALALVTRPLSYMREQPLDAAAWLPIGSALKVPGAVAKGSKALARTRKVSEAGKEAMTYWKNTKSGDIVRGVGKSIVDAAPVPNGLKRAFIDLYAGTPEPFKALRKKFQRKRDADSAVIEEFVLQPLHKMAKQKNIGPEEMSQMYTALVSTLQTVSQRKKAVALAMEPDSSTKRLLMGGARHEIDSAVPKYVTWEYDGIPMNTSQFIFDFKPQQWDAAKITAKIMPDAPPAVRQNIDRLIAIKKTLFDLGANQTKVKTSPGFGGVGRGRHARVSDNTFLAEDFFKATASDYLPLVKTQAGGMPDWKTWFSLKKRWNEVDTGMTGTAADVRKYAAKSADWVNKLKDEGYAVGDRFIEALELSLPKTIDTLERYRFYQQVAENADLASKVPKKGWVKIEAPKAGLHKSRDMTKGGDIMRYGALEGMYVPKGVRAVIRGGEKHIKDYENLFTKLGDSHRALLNMVKHNKLIANFSTQFHNIYGVANLVVGESLDAFNPLSPTKFRHVWEDSLKFMKHKDDPFYRALLETGTLPKAARGVGDISDITSAIIKTHNPFDFAKVMWKDMDKQVKGGRGRIAAGASTLARGAPALPMKTLEFASYGVLGAGGRMAKWFTAVDRMARYGFFKKRLREVAKEAGVSPEQALKNPKLVDEAAKFQSDIMLDYSDLPTAVQWMRQSGVAPFIAYPWRATRYYLEYPFRKRKSYLTLDAWQRAEHQTDTKEDRQRRRSRFPGDFMYPVSRGLRDIMNKASLAGGGPKWDEVNISGRYWSPVPRVPEETLGLSVDRFAGKGTTIGEAGLTWLDQRSSAGRITEALGIDMPEGYGRRDWKGEEIGGLPIPDPMGLAPILKMLDPKEVKDLDGEKRAPTLSERLLRGASEGAPTYMPKLSRDQLYGLPVEKRDLIAQSLFGLRVIPKTHRKAAFDRGQQAIRKLKGEPRYKGATYKDQMRMEEEALRRQSRLTLF